MSRITKQFVKTPERGIMPDTINMENFPAYGKSTKTQYLQMLMTNTMSNVFYADKDEQTAEALALHVAAINEFPEFMTKAAVYARNKGYMRSQPVMAMAYLAKSGHPNFEQYFDQVILTPNDLIDFLTFYGTLAKGQGGRRIKRVVGNWIRTKLSAYWIVKYGSEGKSGYSLRDLLITIHPKGFDSGFANYILKGILPAKSRELTQFMGEQYEQLRQFEGLKNAMTEKEAVAFVMAGRLPHEVVTSVAGQFPGVWDALVPNMPIFALMRNLVTLDRHKVLDKNKAVVETTLLDPEKVKKSKILPFQWVKAFEMSLGLPDWVRDALRGAVDLSVDCIPDVLNKSTIALDISGSMGRETLRTGAILGVALAKKSDDVVFYTFNTRVAKASVSKRDTVLSQADNFRSGGGTDTGAVGQQIIKDAKSGRIVENVIVFTDEQPNQNTGATFYECMKDYRRKYNKNLKVFIVDVGSLAVSGGVIPETDKDFYILGWSPKILDFVALSAQGFDTMADAIEKGGM